MVFFMIMPTLFGAFGNFLLPTQLGVHDVAFPRLNSAAFWFLPGGLIMLAQLVCIDRRYQRMNCFNIRELQSILKKRFFNDLVSSGDHRELLHSTMVGLRYKNNSNTLLEADIFSFYATGTTFTNKSKNIQLEDNFLRTLNLDLPSLPYLVNYISTLISNFMHVAVVKPLLGNNLPNDRLYNFNSHFHNTILAYDELLFNFVRVLQNINI